MCHCRNSDYDLWPLKANQRQIWRWQSKARGCFPIGPPLSPTSYLLPFSSYLHISVPILYNGGGALPRHAPFPWTDPDPRYYNVRTVHTSPHAKRQIDPYRRFCRAHERSRHTEGPRHGIICKNRPHKCMKCIRCGLIFCSNETR